jgi:hypothetical protein
MHHSGRKKRPFRSDPKAQNRASRFNKLQVIAGNFVNFVVPTSIKDLEILEEF